MDNKAYVGFRDIQTVHNCWFESKDATSLKLYSSPQDFTNGKQPLMDSVTCTPIKALNGITTLGIEYSYYINTIVSLLKERKATGATQNQTVPKPASTTTSTTAPTLFVESNLQKRTSEEGFELLVINGTDYVRTADIAEKHKPKGSFSYMPNGTMSLYSSKDRPILLLENIPFKRTDKAFCVEYSFYLEKILPLLK